MNPNIINTNQGSSQPRFLKWSLIFAIAIVSNMFINYALSLVYPAPKYDAYCPQGQVIEALKTKNDCISAGGQWNENGVYDTSMISPGEKLTKPAGYCNQNYTCSNSYQEAKIAYDRNVFIVLVASGVVLIALGFIFAANSVVKMSMSLAGSLSLVVASVRYWSEAHDLLKVVILGVALASLIILAIKKFSEKIRPQ